MVCFPSGGSRFKNANLAVSQSPGLTNRGGVLVTTNPGNAFWTVGKGWRLFLELPAAGDYFRWE
jgi:hypothetical protein